MEKYSDIDMSENHIENPVNISYTSTYSVCEAAQDTVLSFSDKYVESEESFIAKGFTRKRITQVYNLYLPDSQYDFRSYQYHYIFPLL